MCIRDRDDDVEAEKKIELANDDFAAIAATILEGCGGKDNIASIDNCITRLRQMCIRDSYRITSRTEQRILVRYHRTWRSEALLGR